MVLLFVVRLPSDKSLYSFTVVSPGVFGTAAQLLSFLSRSMHLAGLFTYLYLAPTDLYSA
jgi:hypothetical protein